MVKKQNLIITRKVLEVTPLDEGGADEYNVRDYFTQGKNYKVFGAMWVRYDDGSGVSCWLVEDDRGVIEPKAMCRFKVTKMEDE